MTIPIAPLVVTLLGVLAYCLPLPPKAQELGRLAYACGLLVTLWRLASETLHLH